MKKQIKNWMKHRNLADDLAWVAFGIVVLYFFLKIIGVLQSPLSIDVAALVSGTYFIGRFSQKIDILFKDVEKIKSDVEDMKPTMKVLNKRCPVLKNEEIGCKSA